MRYYYKLLKHIDNKDNFLSLKNNINMVREELNSEEKFFEKAVITERFVKKYKNVMISSIVAIVVLVGANIAYEANQQSKRDSANKAISQLSKNSKDAKALAELKSASLPLYNVWTFSKAVVDKDIATLKELQNSKTLIINDLAKYELAQNTNDIEALNDYSLKQNAIYKDLALVQSAIMLMNDGKTKEAHEKLIKVSQESSLNNIAKALLHYGVK